MESANAFHFCYKAKERDNLTKVAKTHRRASDYVLLLDPATDYNFSDAENLPAETRPFDTWLAIDAAEIKGATAKAALSALNDFLRDDLRAGMELLKDTHEDAYQALREASQVDDAMMRGMGRGRRRMKSRKQTLIILKTPPVNQWATTGMTSLQRINF
jgi:hypothetical protein